MEKYKKYLVGGMFGLFLSFSFVARQGLLRGVYVLSINSLIIFVWTVLTAHGRGKHRIALKIQTYLIFGTLSVFFATLFLMGIVYNRWDLVGGLLMIFVAFSLFILMLIIFERIAVQKGKELKYSPRDMKVFWAFQWLANLSLVLKSNTPLETFLLILPAILGGYLLFKGLVTIKLS
ncbi:hypothetical protein QDY65_06270 [Pyrococcus kukulkanii]|uniref:Uncharacterized protein n=1 Tax=Pyrococcus kukulkanii TaxID=1609559 RepID=A0A127B6U1_9EURY|nr:hypothetical protein [Pyrococcus kukulkanii]AMM53100.1 hypothetical protein TQ32_00275 [Pyrococcus kukulkanii]